MGRVTAFGYHAGYAGAALALESWAWQLNNPADKPMPGVTSYPSRDLLLEDVKSKVLEGESKAGRKPRVLVIGALGRCGRGAVDLRKQAGLPDEDILKWDLPETTAKPGPYKEITDSDVFVDCIYLSDEIPPFVNDKSLSGPDRKLSVIYDVSCETTNPHNPIPESSVRNSRSRRVPPPCGNQANTPCRPLCPF
jgi:saccharopine dehydrogenase (NAD+, L-lysine-forming)